MLSQIPTHLIGGPLGAGKTSLLRELLAQKPPAERWAVLINEFGQIGLDAALLATGDDGIGFAEVAGGCLCCVSGAPFQVGLSRLLRRARPDRLFIEPSGLGHPLALLEQLQQPPWRGVLAVQPLVMLLDAAALACGAALPDSQREALPQAGLIVLNKAETLDEQTRQRLAASLPPRPLHWTSHGRLALAELPGVNCSPAPAQEPPAAPASTSSMPGVWLDPREPICQVQAQPEGWAIGWRWHPSQRFDLQRVEAWLADQPWRRAKLVLHGEVGWQSANALDGAALEWRGSEWRRDSRLELIFAAAQDTATLTDQVQTCLLPAA
ncbi:CobW family GTP-binding protein [Pseudomonas mangrovi]|uniref:Cobalamin biosynthesis protein CobW n=1 Tax=Pseudomonas mangrovi TaxID=2161748 RepID=A0A2T5P9Q2_9PSED|nr:CobW family GTP-binding protein [Pseudomonas mangrovi]PTU74470.1 cobalamin biosynthesis protein CobW [Pseudomonas mangrovi]